MEKITDAEATDALRSEGDASSRSTITNRNRPAPSMGIGDRSMHHSHEVTELDNLTGVENSRSAKEETRDTLGNVSEAAKGYKEERTTTKSDPQGVGAVA